MAFERNMEVCIALNECFPGLTWACHTEQHVVGTTESVRVDVGWTFDKVTPPGRKEAGVVEFRREEKFTVTVSTACLPPTDPTIPKKLVPVAQDVGSPDVVDAVDKALRNAFTLHSVQAAVLKGLLGDK